MRILILSDIHDNIVRLRHVLGFAPEIGIEAIIVCGDWGRALTTIDEFHTVKNEGGVYGMKIYGVLGNADINPEMPKALSNAGIEFDKDFLELNVGNRKIGLAHYPTSSVTLGGKALKQAAQSQTYDILFHGHTHKKTETILGRTLIVNPGALSRTLSPSFAVYDTAKNSVEFVNIVA